MYFLEVWEDNPVEKHFEKAFWKKMGKYFPISSPLRYILYICRRSQGVEKPVSHSCGYIENASLFARPSSLFCSLPPGSHTAIKCLHLRLCFCSGFQGIKAKMLLIMRMSMSSPSLLILDDLKFHNS